MAIYHLRLKVVSRGNARSSVVAAAAYRSGDKLYDEALKRFWDYRKPDVIHTEILAPDGAAAWVFDRQVLWNRVEAAEKRVDAQLAREIEITLPRELSRADQVALVRDFVREQFVAKGMVADCALHCPVAADGALQPHAHVLLSLRRLDPGSATGFAGTKERDWNESPEVFRAVAEARKRFNNTGLEVDREALEAAEATRNVNVWRAAWAEYANRRLALVGSQARIDHRTLEKQGIFRLPLPYFGVARHIEKAYDYLKERITQWVAIKQRAALYADLQHYQRRDPVKLAAFVLQIADMAEGFAASFRKPQAPIPEVEVSHER